MRKSQFIEEQVVGVKEHAARWPAVPEVATSARRRSIDGDTNAARARNEAARYRL
jgi:hypothetical protein